MRWLPAVMLSVLVLSGCAAEPEQDADAQATAAGPSQTGTGPSTNATSSATAPAISGLTANVTGLEVTFTFTGRAGQGASWSLAFGDGNQTNGTVVTGALQPVDKANTTLNGSVGHAYAAPGTYNATLTLRDAAGAADRTIAVNVTANGTAAPIVALATYQFTGSLPLDGATVGEHLFAVPAGATQVTMVYTSEYVGLFTAVATATDPAGTDRMYSLDTCSVGLAPPSGTRSCAMATDGPVDAGDWTATVSYQAGQATEDYTLDIVVYGR